MTDTAPTEAARAAEDLVDPTLHAGLAIDGAAAHLVADSVAAGRAGAEQAGPAVAATAKQRRTGRPL